MSSFPVNGSEQFIAQGRYTYQVSGKKSGLSETWSLHRLPNGQWEHRAEIKGKIAALRLKQNSRFTLQPTYRPDLLQMIQTIGDDTGERTTETRIVCSETSIEQTITTEGETEKIVLGVQAGFGLFFPPVSAQGFLAKTYDLSLGGKQPLTQAAVRIQPQNGLPLSVEVQTIAYEYIDNNEEIETPAGQFSCHHFIRYDQHMQQQLWLDEHWIPVQWSVPYSAIMKWEYLLTRYYREG